MSALYTSLAVRVRDTHPQFEPSLTKRGPFAPTPLTDSVERHKDIAKPNKPEIENDLWCAHELLLEKVLEKVTPQNRQDWSTLLDGWVGYLIKLKIDVPANLISWAGSLLGSGVRFLLLGANIAPQRRSVQWRNKRGFNQNRRPQKRIRALSERALTTWNARCSSRTKRTRYNSGTRRSKHSQTRQL